MKHYSIVWQCYSCSHVAPMLVHMDTRVRIKIAKQMVNAAAFHKLTRVPPFVQFDPNVDDALFGTQNRHNDSVYIQVTFYIRLQLRSEEELDYHLRHYCVEMTRQPRP